MGGIFSPDDEEVDLKTLRALSEETGARAFNLPQVGDGDELNRDPRDIARERMKTEEEVRMEDQLAAQISRVKLKRSHSTTSLKSEGPETPPAQPTAVIASVAEHVRE